MPTVNKYRMYKINPSCFLLADGRDDLYGIQEHVGHIDRNSAAPFEARPNRLRVLPSTQDAL
jgi:hypothetical protein